MDHCNPHTPKCPLCPSATSAVSYLPNGVEIHFPSLSSLFNLLSTDTLSDQGVVMAIFHPPTIISQSYCLFSHSLPSSRSFSCQNKSLVIGFKWGEEKKKWRVIQETSIEENAPHAVERMKGSLGFAFTVGIHFKEKEDFRLETDISSLGQSVSSLQERFYLSQ